MAIFPLLLISILIFPQASLGEDVCGCLSYCYSVAPGTIQATCDQEAGACNCINANNAMMRVNFVPQRQPVPSTTTTTTTTTTTPPPMPAFDYAPSGPVPILLECNGNAHANQICNDFCILQIYAFYGECDTVGKTCRCTGVQESILQEAPIAAIFEPPPATTTQAPPTMTMSQWNPITPNHPHYYQSLAPLPTYDSYYYGQHQQQQQGYNNIQPPQFIFPQQWVPIQEQEKKEPQIPPYLTYYGKEREDLEQTTTTPPTTTTTSTEISSSVSVTSDDDDDGVVVVEEEGEAGQDEMLGNHKTE